MARTLRFVLWSLLWIVALAALAATIVPRFLDRIYYVGARSGHYDGARFFNPDGEDTLRPPGGGGRLGLLQRFVTGSDGRPPWPGRVPVRPATDDELLQPGPVPIAFVPADAATIAATPMRATWIGHATVLVQTPGLNILTDPIWSDVAGPFGVGPRRVAAPGTAFDTLPKIDVVLVSHNHYDHMDLATLKRLWQRDRPLIVSSLGNEAILRSAGIDAVGLDWGRSVVAQPRPLVSDSSFVTTPVRVHVTRNHHWGSRWFTDRNRALWSSFVVELPGGNLFFAGDTGLGDGRWPAEAAALGPVRLAIIPIGAFRFQPGQMGTGSHIGPVDAVGVFSGLRARTALPIHWGTFRLSYEAYDTPPKLLKAALACAGLANARFTAQPIGRPFDVPPLGAEPGVAKSRAEILRCLDTPAVRALR